MKTWAFALTIWLLGVMSGCLIRDIQQPRHKALVTFLGKHFVTLYDDFAPGGRLMSREDFDRWSVGRHRTDISFAPGYDRLKP